MFRAFQVFFLEVANIIKKRIVHIWDYCVIAMVFYTLQRDNSFSKRVCFSKRVSLGSFRHFVLLPVLEVIESESARFRFDLITWLGTTRWLITRFRRIPRFALKWRLRRVSVASPQVCDGLRSCTTDKRLAQSQRSPGKRIEGQTLMCGEEYGPATAPAA